MVRKQVRWLVTAAWLGAAGCGDGEKGPQGDVGEPGSPGEAASCSVKDNGDGTKTVSCSDGTQITLSDGAAGQNGQNGQNGQSGAAGAEGASCSVTANNDGTKTIKCEDGTTATVADGQSGPQGIQGIAGTSCTVTKNSNGTNTITCADGTKVTVSDGADGQNGGNVQVSNFHGSALLMSIGEFANGAKYFVDATISAATASAEGVVSVNFSVKTKDGKPLRDLASVGANISKLVPGASAFQSAHWMPYLYARQTVSGSASGNWPKPDGTYADQATRETNGTLTNHGDGTYTYVFAKNLTQATFNGQPVTYERNLTHRIVIMMGGHSGPTADAVFDFVPDASGAVGTRDIVRTATCKSCHGDEFHGHGGDRLNVGDCATCHVPDTTDPHSGESLDLKVMIHKIHAGGDLPSVKGADGIVWDNPATPVDESADNGQYAIWGYQNRKVSWEKVGFPAVFGNCNKCHDGTGADSDNWKTKPSQAACESCHDDADISAGTKHPIAIADDAACHLCHGSSSTAAPGAKDVSIPFVHNFTAADPRNTPEFNVALSVSYPQGRNYFIAGESPVVTIKLTDADNPGTPIDHTTLIEDATGEGCLSTGCPARDGALRAASFFVHGPRADRYPVLTTQARAFLRSSSVGPFNLSSATTLTVLVDQARDVGTTDRWGTDKVLAGRIVVPVSGGTFADLSAATATEIVTWLNANSAFTARAIAYLDGGKVALRSRNLGLVHAIALEAGTVTTNVFGGDVTVHLPGGANNISKRTVSSNNDPKVAWFTDRIEYTLDPVDDLVPGSYVASVELGDRGRIDDNNYKTPSVAKLAFQVKTGTAELPVAGNCDTCHQANTGAGLVFDPARHNKIFDDTAIDQCGACHDYQPGAVTGSAWSGAKPISKRVHAVHFGSSLKKPNATVDHADTVAGRNWDITFPQDVRNCETCHEKGKTSGSWATNPSRLPCMGCHDSDAAQAHMKLQTFDPTPNDPWSGDEQESCNTCH